MPEVFPELPSDHDEGRDPAFLTPSAQDGSIINSSGTPRNEVGGLALIEGVLMRSRTGFAIALRQRDGSIKVTQVPWKFFHPKGKWRQLPIFRGTSSILEMLSLGSKALNYSAAAFEQNEDDPEIPDDQWDFQQPMTTREILPMIVLSMISVGFAFLVLPESLTYLIFHFAGVDPTQGFITGTVGFLIFFNILAFLIRLLILTGYIFFIGLNRDIYRVFQYHGAEHKAVLALEDGGEVTVDRAQRHDTIHPRCGTSFLAIFVMMSFVLFAVADVILISYIPDFLSWNWLSQLSLLIVLHGVLLPVVAGVSFEILKLSAQFTRNPFSQIFLRPGMLLQRLSTRNPDDFQTEVAIIALRAAMAIPYHQKETKTFRVKGLIDDESAPGYCPSPLGRPKVSPENTPE